MNQPKQVESYLSSEGFGVIAGLLIIGGVLLGVTGSGKFTVVLFLLAGVVMAGWAWMNRARPAPSEPRRPIDSPATRSTKAPRYERAAAPAVRVAPAAEGVEDQAEDRFEAKAEERVEDQAEPKTDKAAEPPAPPVLPPAAAKLMKALEARSAEGIGQTVRVETLFASGDSIGAVHLVVSGDGPAQDLWFGRDGDPLPLEIIVGRMPPGGVAGVTISSKAVSAQQARLSQHEGTFLIENLSKTNATRVGGRALQDGERRALADGDLIEMGPVGIRYHLE